MNADEPGGDPIDRARRIRQRIQALIEHLREDIDAADEASAEALFETTLEVLVGLRTAYEHYEQKSEEAWRG